MRTREGEREHPLENWVLNSCLSQYAARLSVIQLWNVAYFAFMQHTHKHTHAGECSHRYSACIMQIREDNVHFISSQIYACCCCCCSLLLLFLLLLLLNSDSSWTCNVNRFIYKITKPVSIRQYLWQHVAKLIGRMLLVKLLYPLQRVYSFWAGVWNTPKKTYLNIYLFIFLFI